MLSTEAVESFFGWINERHAIYQRRAGGQPPPWTDDAILASYKFTNPFRENDRVTVWMREHWTNPNHNRPAGEIIFNCCLFRMIGTSEFAADHGWATDWNPDRTKQLIMDRLARKERTFTGAYIITNQGLKDPKAVVVVDHFLTPVWRDREKLADVAQTTNSLQALHAEFALYKGWGGGGFMAYEVVTDLNYTSVMPEPVDRYSWANAGPGAIRGLNRLHKRDLKKGMKQTQANTEMRELLIKAADYVAPHVPIDNVDMRAIEHSLCEWDKYQRVLHGQGEPRSKFSADLARTHVKGAIE